MAPIASHKRDVSAPINATYIFLVASPTIWRSAPHGHKYGVFMGKIGVGRRSPTKVPADPQFIYGDRHPNANNSTNLNSIDNPLILQHSMESNYPPSRSFHFAHSGGCFCKADNPPATKIGPIWRRSPPINATYLHP